MSAHLQAPGAERTVRPLLPPGTPATVADFIADLGLHRAADQSGPQTTASQPDEGRPRPTVLVNMVATVDGRAALEGRTAALGNWADRELFHALRAEADAVMVGAGTVRTERYGRIVRDPATRERRRRAGRPEEPLAVIVSASLGLAADLPLLAAAEARVVILTGSDGELPPCDATVEYVRTPDGALDLPAALAELHDRLGVEILLCEGGPRLNADLLAAGMVDELFLSVSPQLAGGRDALRIVHGDELSPPVQLELASVLESESHLFLRYRVAER